MAKLCVEGTAHVHRQEALRPRRAGRFIRSFRLHDDEMRKELAKVSQDREWIESMVAGMSDVEPMYRRPNGPNPASEK